MIAAEALASGRDQATTALSIGAIRTDGGTQPRDHVNVEIIARYAEELDGGAVFPPVVVFYDGSSYWLADGFHRLQAHQALGLAEIACDVRQGTQRDAVLFSVGANATHGYPRSSADKRRAVLTLLRDDEWAKWSDREIAKRTATTHPFVAKVRNEIAPSGNGFQMERKVERGGTVYVQNITNIGKARPQPDIPVFDQTPMAQGAAEADDPVAIPPLLDRRKPAEPLAPSRAGRASWLATELISAVADDPAIIARSLLGDPAERATIFREAARTCLAVAEEIENGRAQHH